MRGGGVYGAGVYGRTINTYDVTLDESGATGTHNNAKKRTGKKGIIARRRNRPVDEDTLHNILIRHMEATKRVTGVYAYTDAQRKRIRLSDTDTQRLVAFIGTRRASEFVTKQYHNDIGDTPAEPNVKSMSTKSFLSELDIVRMITRSLTMRDLRRTTTLGAIPFTLTDTDTSTTRSQQPPQRQVNIIGIHVPSLGHFAFSTKCNTPMDKFKFSNDTQMDSFVTDILHAFSCIHKADVFHCDVKLDNMIYCSSDNRFKLIDWGKSATKDVLVRRYARMSAFPNNTASPMAWLAWGLSYSASIVYTSYTMLKHMKNMIVCPRIISFVTHAYESYEKALHCIVHESTGDHSIMKVPSDFKLIEMSFRRKIVRMYGNTFDLFDFGFILVSLSCAFSKVLSTNMVNKMNTFARRLTSYGDDNFIRDADEAIQSWTFRNGTPA